MLPRFRLGAMVTIGPKPLGVLKPYHETIKPVSSGNETIVTIGPKPLGVLKLISRIYEYFLLLDTN